MKRALVILGLVLIVVGVAVGQCPHAFFKAHNLRGETTCESHGCTYTDRMKSLIPCAMEEARYELSVRFPGRDAQWAETEGPDLIKFNDGLFVAPGFGVVYGLTTWLEGGSIETTVGFVGDVSEDFDTLTHEIKHSMIARVFKGDKGEKFHQELDNGSHTLWYQQRQVSN